MSDSSEAIEKYKEDGKYVNFCFYCPITVCDKDCYKVLTEK